MVYYRCYILLDFNLLTLEQKIVHTILFNIDVWDIIWCLVYVDLNGLNCISILWSRPAPGFGLPKPVTILVAHLLLNIKNHHKSPKKNVMQNKCYIMFLAWITLKKTIKTKCNPGYSNYMSNSFLTKKFLSVNRKKKSQSYKEQQN